MNKVVASIFTLLVASQGAFGQWSVDSVKMGPGSSNDVFYSLKNGTVKTENNKNWHLAFSMSPSDSGAIWANHNTGNSFVKVYNIHKAYAQWSTVTLADTMTATLCYNYDKGWFQGALNDIPSPNVFNFGWGTYDIGTHNVTGDSIFIVKADTNFYKVFINQLVSVPMDYTISIENLNGGTTMTDTISRGTMYADRIFAYYNLNTMADSNREPAKLTWDLVFNRYNTLATQGSVTIPYPVVGGLSNKGIKVAKVPMMHVDTTFAKYGDYTMPWAANSTMISGVGYDWKVPPSGPPPATWVIPDSLSYFIEEMGGSLYQLQFTGYTGSGSGTIYLRKRMVNPVGINDNNSTISAYEFYPNPCMNELSITLNSKKAAGVDVLLTDLNGKTLVRKSFNLSQGLNSIQLNTASIAAGNYILSVQGKEISLKEKISIIK